MIFRSRSLAGAKMPRAIRSRWMQFVPNYGERYRNGESIASGFVESAINQVVSEKTTDGMEPAWSTSPPADKNPRTRRGVGEYLPALVSVFPPSSASQESGLTPENLPLSNRARFIACYPQGESEGMIRKRAGEGGVLFRIWYLCWNLTN
jgi:hypothetical protein